MDGHNGGAWKGATSNGAFEGYASSFIVDKSKSEQFNITTPENVNDNVFKKANKYKYWARQLINNKSGITLQGRVDDNSIFNYEIQQ